MEAYPLMSDCDRRFWDVYWGDRQATLTARTMTQVLDRIKLGYLRAILPPSGATLEVGAGSGRLSCLLGMAGYRTVCLDYSLEALKAAQVNYATAKTQGRFIVGDGSGLPLRDGAFDVVLSTGLLEHFHDPSPIVREMVRVLKPGGLFYSDIVPLKFSLFRSFDWLGNMKRAVTGERIEAMYERSFTQHEILELLMTQGLVQARVFPAGVVPPYIPVLSRFPRVRDWQVRLVERTQAFWKRFDGTWLGEVLGFYYFVWARKAHAHDEVDAERTRAAGVPAASRGVR
jgi:SAM-dependent methyltransferase